MKPVYITAWDVSMKNSGGAGMHPTDFSSISNQDKWRTTIGGTLALLSFLLFVAVGPAVATFLNLAVPRDSWSPSCFQFSSLVWRRTSCARRDSVKRGGVASRLFSRTGALPIVNGTDSAA